MTVGSDLIGERGLLDDDDDENPPDLTVVVVLVPFLGALRTRAPAAAMPPTAKIVPTAMPAAAPAPMLPVDDDGGLPVLPLPAPAGPGVTHAVKHSRRVFRVLRVLKVAASTDALSIIKESTLALASTSLLLSTVILKLMTSGNNCCKLRPALSLLLLLLLLLLL